MRMPGAIRSLFSSHLKKTHRFLASLKLAIPLLVITVVVTIIGSLFPDPEIFKTWWYISLLGALGLSLLMITLLHIPSLSRRRGRNALIGVVMVHTAILILIAGAMYGGLSGFRYKVRAIEGEMTIVPGLSFVIYLDELLIEEYPKETFAHLNLERLPKKTQDSRISLYRSGELLARVVAAPGAPARVEGVTILPAIADTGWFFELIVTDPQGREQTIPVRPWAPPLIKIGSTEIMAHTLQEAGTHSAQVFTIADEQMKVLGTVGEGQTLNIDNHTISLGAFKRYTGMAVYYRPQMPVLVLGCLLMIAGMVGHFYYRYRDESSGDKDHAGTI